MPKIHARLSVEFDVSDHEFNAIVRNAKDENGNIYPMIDMPDILIAKLNRAKPCDWDEYGYIPDSWLEWDIEHREEVSV